MKYAKRTSYDIKDNFVYNLLMDRGIINNDDEYTSKYFVPRKTTNELSPTLLDNMEEGYQLLLKYLKNNSTIYLISDCDVDGFTSSSLFYNYITKYFDEFEPKIIYHIPEGKEHGLDTIMDWFPEDGNDSLVVLPDSSSNDYEQHKELKERGYEILVLDHHSTDKYSENAVVINNQPSARYENKSLSGVGVVYKFLEYIEMKQGWPPYSQDYLDIVALGEIGDVMDMNTLENRYILTGLNHINNKFFQELLDKQDFSLKGERTQIGIAFYIVPPINSLIRLGTQIDKENLFKAFTQPDLIVPSTKRGHAPNETETIGEQMARVCINTKAKQNKERDKAQELIDIQISNNCLDDNKIIIVNIEDMDIPKTMTGLCAMGIVSKYKKPILLGRIDSTGYFRGSMRAPNNCSIKDFRQFLLDSKLMDFAEGHAFACGISLKASNIDKLVEYANNKLKNINFNEGMWDVDFVLNAYQSYLPNLIKDITESKHLWGTANPEPVIVIEEIVVDPSNIFYKGAEKNTVSFISNGVEYIKFKDDDLANKLSFYSNKIVINVIGTAQINEWGGKSTKQILIKDIEIKETDEFDF